MFFQLFSSLVSFHVSRFSVAEAGGVTIDRERVAFFGVNERNLGGGCADLAVLDTCRKQQPAFLENA